MTRPLLLLLLLGSSSGCASVALGGAAGFDAGTVGVGDVETGLGGQVEAIFFPRATSRFGLGPSVQLAGYSTGADADPIALTTLEVRYHSDSGLSGRPYLALGTGAGLAWTPGLHHLAVPVQLEVGFERALGSARGRIGLRERFVGLVGSGDPSLEAFNSVQLVLGLRFGRVAPRPE